MNADSWKRVGEKMEMVAGQLSIASPRSGHAEIAMLFATFARTIAVEIVAEDAKYSTEAYCASKGTQANGGN